MSDPYKARHDIIDEVLRMYNRSTYQSKVDILMSALIRMSDIHLIGVRNEAAELLKVQDAPPPLKWHSQK